MLLAKLHMDALEPQITRSGLKKVLDNLPNDLASAFKDTVNRIDKQPNPQKLLARSALMWVVGARRLLTVKELRCAVALKLESPGFSSTGKPPLAAITSVCAGLLMVDKADSPREDTESKNDINSRNENSVIRLVRKSRKDIYLI